MKIALIVVHTKTFLPRMLELGQVLKKSGRYEPIFYLACWSDLAPGIERLQSAGLRVSEVNLTEAQNKVLAEKISVYEERPILVRPYRKLFEMLQGKIKQLVNEMILYLVDDLFMEMRNLAGRLQFVRELIKQEKADVLVIAYDCPQWDSPAFVKASHKEEIPAVVSISQTGLGEEWVEVYSNAKDLSTKRLPNRLVSYIYPKWAYEFRGREFVMMKAGRILAREFMGMSYRFPWIDGSSNADAVLIENEIYYQRGISAGLRKDKLFLTGYTVHDRMVEVSKEANSLREALYQQLDLPSGRPMILSSLLPPYHGRQRPYQYFKKYDDLVAFWIQSLAAIEGFNIVISLHPSMDYYEMSYIEKWGVKISTHSMADTVCLCDIYVTSLSTTIAWAIACGKPVINYDFGRYRYKNYEGADGVITVEEKEDFLAVLKRLTGDATYYAEIAAKQAAIAEKWGKLDGQAGARILNLFDLLVERYEGRRSDGEGKL